MSRRTCVVAALGAATTLVVALPAAPAAAHPLGAPQTMQISADGNRVLLTWRAAEDDFTALGLELGVLAEARTFVYDRGVLVPEESDDGDATLLAQAPELEDYLLRSIAVRQDDAACAGRLTSADQLLEEGARLAFDCPREADEVDIRVSTLVDLNPSYRTLAAEPGGDRAVYTGTETSHTWQLGGSAGGRDARGLLILGLALGLPVAAAGGVWYRRRAAR